MAFNRRVCSFDEIEKPSMKEDLGHGFTAEFVKSDFWKKSILFVKKDSEELFSSDLSHGRVLWENMKNRHWRESMPDEIKNKIDEFAARVVKLRSFE